MYIIACCLEKWPYFWLKNFLVSQMFTKFGVKSSRGDALDGTPAQDMQQRTNVY
jgi:hypothetical protein